MFSSFLDVSSFLERFDSGIEATDSTDASVLANEDESLNQPDRQQGNSCIEIMLMMKASDLL